MAEKLMVELQDANGNIFYVQTSATAVFCADGKTVQEKIGTVKGRIATKDNLKLVTEANYLAEAKAVKDLFDELNSNLKKQYVQSGRASTQNVNGYFRQAQIAFPKAYKTVPHVVATLLNYQTNAIDVRLGCSVKDISTTGCKVFVMDPEGNITGQGYEITWVAVGEIN